MISLQNIYKSFGAHQVLDGVSLEIESGVKVGLVGPSGVGKSVLLKIMGGIYQQDFGEVDVEGIEHSDIGLMFQEGALFDSLNVQDNVAFPLVKGRVPIEILGRKKRRAVRDKVIDILDRVGLAKALYKLPSQLSGGMRRRVSLARALVGRPRLLLLDDPTCGLDPVASSVIMKFIDDLHSEYKPTTVLVSHDLRRLIPMVDQIIMLVAGEVVFQGCLKELELTKSPVVRNFIECRYDLPD